MLRTVLQIAEINVLSPIMVTLKGTTLIKGLSVIMKNDIQSRNYLIKQRQLLNVTRVEYR